MKDELPRDLRGLLSGIEFDEDGSCRVIFNPVQAYANAWHVRRELEEEIKNPGTREEDLPGLQTKLKSIIAEIAHIKQRVTNHFEPGAPKDKEGVFADSLDQEAKRKITKAFSDIEAGTYDPRKTSKTLQAVLAAYSFYQRNSRMPSHGELKALGYNDQQATDAKQWLKNKAGSNPDKESLFLPLHTENPGRKTEK